MRSLLVGLPLLLPALALGSLSARAADSWGVRVGAALADLAKALPQHSTTAEPAFVDEPEEALSASPTTEPARSKTGAKGRKPTPARSGGVFVSAATVVRLADARAMPQAVPVAAKAPRPAGLRLVGVAGLGIGMKDGDVLTEVLGTPVRSVGQVIQLVIQARGRREARISGRFWRAGLPWTVVVEQPYLENPASPAAP